MRGPGFEPGSSGWKPEILTTELPTQHDYIKVIFGGFLKFVRDKINKLFKLKFIFLGMLPRDHVKAGFFVSLLLILIIGKSYIIEISIFFFASFLIDTDHYFYYVYKKGNLNLKESYKWFIKQQKKFFSLSKKMQDQVYSAFCFFHGLEPVFLFFLFGALFQRIFIFVSLGMILHLLLDFYHEHITYHLRWRKVSLIYDYFSLRKLKFIEEV